LTDKIADSDEHDALTWVQRCTKLETRSDALFPRPNIAVSEKEHR